MRSQADAAHSNDDAVRDWTPVQIAAGRRRLLVLKLDHLGDFIIAIPAMQALRDHFPRDEIALVCGSWNQSLAESTGLFDAILVHDFFPPDTTARQDTAPRSLSQFLGLTRGRYDIALDLRVEGDTRFLLAHIDAKIRCGIAAEYEFPFLDVALPKPSRGRLLDGSMGKHAFAAADFQSNVLAPSPLHWETDFSQTDRCIIFGPYATLPVGTYNATFHFGSGGASIGSPLCTIEIDVAHRTVPIASCRLGRRDFRAGRATLTFTNPDQYGAIEFRVSTRGRPISGTFRFFGVTIEQTSPDSGYRAMQWSRLLHRQECLSLLVSLVAQRFRRWQPAESAGGFVDAGYALPEQARAVIESPGAVLIAPISRSPIKDWPLSRYGELIEMLSRRNLRVALLGTDDQRAALETIAQPGPPECARVVNLAGQTPWSALPMLFQGAALVISGNSGVAHFAAACGARVLAIFSGTHTPEEWGPRGRRGGVAITGNVPCAPCGFDDIRHCPYEHRCMTMISAKIVFEKAAQLLDAPSP